jgi:hypothetical protein
MLCHVMLCSAHAMRCVLVVLCLTCCCCCSCSCSLYTLACFDADHPPPVESLEDYIVLQAAAFGFQLDTIIRPTDFKEPTLRKNDNVLNNISLDDMQEVGAAVLVFQRMPE